MHPHCRCRLFVSSGRGRLALRLELFAVLQSTDDAQIDGHIDPLSSRINGTVIAVHGEDDDRVHKGELLVEIDPRDFQVAVAHARASLDLAQAKSHRPSRIMPRRLRVFVKARRTISGLSVTPKVMPFCFEQHVVPQEQYDQYTAIASVDAAKTDAARQAARATYEAIAARQAEVDAAQAALDQALLNLSYTRLYAPADGIIGKRKVQLGSRIEPGQTLMFVTETGNIWVTANFKETQLARMRPGQRVTIHSDTFGRDYQGYVENLPGASGDRFSLLPPENATGNYVKVVQRLPVRIRFVAGQDPEHLLHPGMSVEPKVWLR